jgi:hypothetical protein
MKTIRFLSGMAMAMAMTTSSVVIHGEEAFEREPISYSVRPPHDAVQSLERQLADGKLRLEGDDRAVVRQLLGHLGISEASQMLVFSRTSFQNDLIRPNHPRALYFGDDAYVGWVPGGLIEVAAMDPDLGPVFYSLDPHPVTQGTTAATQGPRFIRDDDCLRCHGGTFIRDIPAVLSRSVHTDTHGQPVLSLGSDLVDDTTPIDQRWGGWYVTGIHGSVRHRGNLTISGETLPTQAQRESAANRTNLAGFFDATAYLTATSDLVALMVFEHQLAAHNVLTKAGQHCRWMMFYQQGLQRSFKETVTPEPVYDSVRHAFEHSVEQVLDVLLFKNEAALPVGGVRGGESFASGFRRQGFRSPSGQSLRELDLQHRLFRLRCSYVIQTAFFQNLQPVLRRQILERLHRVLTQPDQEPRYAYLESGERRGILEILEKSITDLPPAWNAHRE